MMNRDFETAGEKLTGKSRVVYALLIELFATLRVSPDEAFPAVEALVKDIPVAKASMQAMTGESKLTH